MKKKLTNCLITHNLGKLYKLLLTMKISFLLIFLSIFQVSAKGYSQEAALNLDMKNTSVREVLKTIESKSDYRFFYNDDFTSLDKRVDLNVHQGKVEDILKHIFADANITYKTMEDNVVVIFPTSELQQNVTVTGTVTDAVTGETLPGVNILIKGTTNGVITDLGGKYSIEVPDNAVLVFSYIGYLTEEVPVNGQRVIDLGMAPDIKNLDEVVVVGYGTQKRSDLTGALSSISSDEYTQQPVTRLDEVLQGRVAGVQVANTTGAPGGDVKIRIRGANSMLGNNNPLYVVDGFVGADFRDVNPNDIESIEVLKDASSTAIYGSRGANGVIIVTTKHGKSGVMKVDAMARYSTSTVINTMDKMSAYEFANVVNERREALELPRYYTDEQIEDYRVNGGTDWQDELFRPAPNYEYQLTLSGGNDLTTYMVSANYLDQDGIIKNTDFKKYAFRTNVRSQISEKFSADVNLSLSRRENHNTDIATGVVSPVTQVIAWAPTTPLRDEDGNYTRSDPVGSIYSNPLNLVTDKNQDYYNSNVNLVGDLNYEFIEGLNLSVEFGVNYNNNQGEFYYGPTITTNTQAIRNSTESIVWQNVNNLTYKKVFNEIHSLTVTGVFEQQKSESTGFSGTANGLTYNNFKYDNLTLAESYYLSSNYSDYSLQSFLGRINYTLMNRYLLTASVRRDGSSKFRGDNKYSTFPSVAFGWRVSEEPFMKNISFLSNLKIRASWGQTGSQAVSPYATYATYQTVTSAFDNSSDTPGIKIQYVENPDLKWETTEQTDLGIDLGFFGGRIQFTGDYYIKNTSDLLLLQVLPDYLGGSSLYRNVGEVRNEGLEFYLSVIPVMNKDFEWNSSFNFSYLENEVKSLGDMNQDMIFTGSKVGAGLSQQSEFVYTPGEPLGSFWGLKYLGTWKPEDELRAYFYGAKPGDARYEDLDGDFSITSSDYQIIGNGQPKYTLGWNNTFTYKGLSLNVFLQGILDFDKFNYTYAAAITSNGDARQPTLSDIQDRYIPGVNETSDIPAFSSSNVNHVQSSRFLEKGDFIRLKNLSLTYQLPGSLVKSFGASIFAGGTNLLTFTDYKGIDPEVSTRGSSTDIDQNIDYGAYPNSKTFYVGLKFSF